MAYELETAGKKLDEAFILANNRAFTNGFDSLAAQVLEIIANHKEKNRQKGDTNILKEMLKKISPAVSDMDYSLCTKLLREVNRNTYGQVADDLISDLTDAVNDFDFDLAEDILSELSERAEKAFLTF